MVDSEFEVAPGKNDRWIVYYREHNPRGVFKNLSQAIAHAEDEAAYTEIHGFPPERKDLIQATLFDNSEVVDES